MTQAATWNSGPEHEPPSSMTICSRLPGELAIALDGEPIPSPPQRTQGSMAVLLLYPAPNGTSTWLERAHPIDIHSNVHCPVSDLAAPEEGEPACFASPPGARPGL
jgi:hypothetical protein